MMKNVGALDRAIRLAVVVAVAAAYLLGHLSGTLALILGLVAAVFLVTGLLSNCPAYRLLGFSTRKSD